MSRIRLLALFFNIILTTSLLAFDGETSTESEILSSTQNPLAALHGVPETNIHGVNVSKD